MYNFSTIDPSFNIYMADDDIEDIKLTKEAFKHNDLPVLLTYVHDGQDLLDLLRSEGKFIAARRELPQLILLDLNMHRKDGREALKEIKSDILLKNIPVIIYTTSNAPDDISSAYAMGANCYITKPFNFSELTNTMDSLVRFWMKHVQLPS